MKECTKCHLIKDESQYHFVNKKRNNKLRSDCKACRKIRNMMKYIERKHSRKE